MTIDEVYKFVKLMANKENRGWIKPSEFNLLATRAQLDLIKDRVGSISQDGVVNGYKDNSQLQDELYGAITEATLTVTSEVFTFPADYLNFLSLTYNGVEVDMVNSSSITRRVKSQLNPPTEDFPVGVITSTGFRIYITDSGPINNGNVILRYINIPTAPNWAFTVVNNVEVYNPSSAVQLVLTEGTHKEIAHRILAYIGVTLREANIVEYGTTTVVEQGK